jgi:hypothetical protein
MFRGYQVPEGKNLEITYRHGPGAYYKTQDSSLKRLKLPKWKKLFERVDQKSFDYESFVTLYAIESGSGICTNEHSGCTKLDPFIIIYGANIDGKWVNLNKLQKLFSFPEERVFVVNDFPGKTFGVEMNLSRELEYFLVNDTISSSFGVEGKGSNVMLFPDYPYAFQRNYWAIY